MSSPENARRISRMFVNLPITDLARTLAFYEGLGFVRNPAFSDDSAACVVLGETHYLMLLTQPRFATFARLPIADARAATQVLTALQLGSKEEVDEVFALALAHGGSEARPLEDLGFMYCRPFADPDGHVFEPFWFDPEAVPPGA